jgi:hypothetical protein
MSKWTPGPWIAEQYCMGKPPDSGCAVVASRDPAKISNPSRGMVAWATRAVGQTGAEVEANAHLIAAAPEMADALMALDAVIDFDPEMAEALAAQLEIKDATALQAACRMARAALAKARGET